MGDCSAIFLTFTMIELCLRCAERGKKSHEHHFMWGGRGGTDDLCVDAPAELCSICCDIYTIWRREKRKKARNT